ncbi:MAG: DUF3048 domain-containing protein [Oscillospiraceae bacterium]
MRYRLLPLVLVLLLSLTACGTKAPEVAPTVSPSASPQVSDPTPTPPPVFLNPLTGLPIDEVRVNARPVAIMLNNLKQALPQMGNSQADVLYEVLAEGGITRMLGVYQSMEGVGTIGSIRSSRPYYLELALGHDAVYLHAGGSEDAYAKISEWNVTALDCVRSTAYSSIFWRDKDRIKNNGYEHSVLTSGEAISAHFGDFSFRKDHEDGYTYSMAFAPDGTPQNGDPASTVTVPFSNYKTGIFRYDSEKKQYAVEEYGKPYLDGNTKEQVTVTNVIVLQTDCHPIDSYGRMAVDLTSGGKGYYANGGQLIPILWTKASRNDQLAYTTEDGAPLTLGAGHSYVSIVPLSANITFE